MSKWFYLDWWRYLFSPVGDYFPDISFWEAVLCRLRGHPQGKVFYNPDLRSIEPDCHCKNCGDKL